MKWECLKILKKKKSDKSGATRLADLPPLFWQS